MYSLGTTSIEKLYTCHNDLVRIIELAITLSKIDFGVAEGHRTVAKQQEYYKQGKSKVDGVTTKGKHNYEPSLAVDIYAYVNGKASWEVSHLSYIAGVIMTCAEILYKQGAITHRLRWGGNWDCDGEIITDQLFVDSPHFELIM